MRHAEFKSLAETALVTSVRSAEDKIHVRGKLDCWKRKCHAIERKRARGRKRRV
jgi:hypothetical protein